MDFYTDALPLLLAMKDSTPEENFPMYDFLQKTVGLTPQKAGHVIKLLHDNDYITGIDSSGFHAGVVALLEPSLTVKALQQIDQWPSDDERGLYLLSKLTDRLDQLATETDSDEERSRLQAAGQTLRDLGISLVAGVITSQV